MNKEFLLGQIAHQIVLGRSHPRGMLGLMEDSERELGYTVVPVGSKLPFAIPRKYWDAALISLDGKDARIVLIAAKKKQSGAFKRLVSAIIAAGYVPVVIEPTGDEMPAILRHWKWKGRRRNGIGWESWEEWRPSMTPAGYDEEGR